MRNIALCLAATLLSCLVSYGDTMTFDEVPAGTSLHLSAYAYAHRVFFSSDFRVADHAASEWGNPQSPPNVLTSEGSPFSRIGFGYYTTSEADPDDIQFVGAYFSTEAGAMVRITAYHFIGPGSEEVTSVLIGAPGETWLNRYVEIRGGPGAPFDSLAHCCPR